MREMRNAYKILSCDMVIGFIEHLQTVTTSNYSATANSHAQQFTTECTKSSQSAVSSPGFAWQWLLML
jgi:hypothetical protein